MAEEIYWLVDKRVLFVRVKEPFKDDAGWRAHLERIHSSVIQGTPPVHLIIDLTKLTAFMNPSSAKSFAENMNKSNPTPSEEQGWTVLLSSNMFIRFVGSLFTQWTGGKTRAVETLDEAVDYLVERDNSLPANIKRLAQTITF